MQVRVYSEGLGESLQECNGSTSGVFQALRRGPALHLFENLIYKDACHPRQDLTSSGQEASELERGRQHPLTKRNVGQHVLDQVGSRVFPSTGGARWTDRPALTGEG